MFSKQVELTTEYGDHTMDMDTVLEMPERRTSFHQLVDSGLDFLSKSFADVQSTPKYSVINFCAGIELLMKARLVHEHWSLITSKPGETSLKQFEEGNFESVNPRQCYERLERICGQRFTDEERLCFKSLADHRNRIVHFYHRTYAKEADQHLVEAIVLEQVRAGAMLMNILRNRWSEEFSPFEEQLRHLEWQFRRHQGYLNAKFELLASQIKQVTDSGQAAVECFYCGKKAAVEIHLRKPLLVHRCLLCEHSRSFIEAECPDCEEEIILFSGGSGACSGCDNDLGLDFLFDLFGGGGSTANCPECNEKAVVAHGEEFLCLNCAHDYEEVGTCDWCGELVAGDMSESYLNGCGQALCDGRIGLLEAD